MSAAANTKIVLLAQKDSSEKTKLACEEGPLESWLAVRQDMWGPGNLTPLDSVFASRAIGALAPARGALFGAVCHHLGRRLFTFGREADIPIESFEGEPGLSRLEMQPWDKVRLTPWVPARNLLGKEKFTHLAVLSPSHLQGPLDRLVQEAAQSLKQGGRLFLADLMARRNGAALPTAPTPHGEGEYRAWLAAAGMELHGEHDLTDDVRVALLRGLHMSLNMLVNTRRLGEPWRSQRLNAFEKELEFAVALRLAMDRGEIAATAFCCVRK